MEYFDIRTPDGKVTGKIKERSLVHRDGDLHGTSHIWLVRKIQRMPGRCCCRNAAPARIPIRESMIFLLQAICLPDRISWNLRFGSWRKNWESKLPLRNCSLLAGTWRRAFPAFTESPWHNHELSAVYVLYRDVEPEKLHLQEEGGGIGAVDGIRRVLKTDSGRHPGELHQPG